MAEASRVTKDIVANRMLLHAVNTETAEAAKAEAEAARAETEKLAAQIELQKLKETVRGGDGQGPDQWQQFILQELTETRKSLEETKGALAQMQVNALIERLNLLEGELGRIRERPQEPAPNTTALVTKAVEEARGLIQIVTPQETATSLPPADNAMIAAWQHRADLDHERWQVQHQSDHEARMEKIRQEGETARAEISQKEKAAAQTNRFMTDTAPEIVKVLKQVATGLFPNGVPGQTAAAQGAASPQTAPGVISGACMNCGQPIYYRATWAGVICPACGEEHNITPEPTDQAASAGGVDGVDNGSIA